VDTLDLLAIISVVRAIEEGRQAARGVDK